MFKKILINILEVAAVEEVAAVVVATVEAIAIVEMTEMVVAEIVTEAVIDIVIALVHRHRLRFYK